MNRNAIAKKKSGTRNAGYQIGLSVVLLACTFLLEMCVPVKPKSSVHSQKITAMLSGKWKVVNLGKTLPLFGLTLPSEYEFRSDGNLRCILTIGGKEKKFEGEYYIDENKTPAQITFYRSDGVELKGYIGNMNGSEVKLILLNPKYLRLPQDFDEDITQLLKRSTN